MENYVFPMLHIFPWKCEQCGGRRIRFKRSKAARAHSVAEASGG